MSSTTFVSYLRVSTGRQVFGTDAQRVDVERYVAREGGKLLKEFQEVESGRGHENRPQLLEALEMCRMTGSVLIVARLDRLSRNVLFLATLLDSKQPFVVCDNPNATPLTIHILAAIAQYERELISVRTKAALAVAKERGVQLGRRDDGIKNYASEGGKKGAITKRALCEKHRAGIRKAAASIQSTDLDVITAELQRLGYKGRQGGPIAKTTVRRALAA